MRRLLLIPFALLLLLAGAMLLSGGAAEKRAQFSFINRGDIYTLDLNQMSYLQDFRLTYGIREGLYDLAPDTFRTIPAGATGYDLSDDKKIWTFHLRPACRWSNGDPVTARDYIFSWRRMLEEPGQYTYLYKYIHNAMAYKRSYAAGDPIDFATVGVTALDDHTLRVSLDNPVAYLLDMMAFPPFYPRHERSMARYRVYGDTILQDVMEPFQRYVAAAASIDPAAAPADIASRLAAKVGHPVPDPAAAEKWVALAHTLDPKTRTQAELLEALAAFAALDPLKDVASSHKAEETVVSEDEGEEAPKDTLAELSPAEKLRRMIDKKFIRYVFNKAYTQPPGVVTNGPFVLSRWDFKRRLRLDKSPTYWDRDHVKLDSVEMVVAENPQTQLLLYETGQVEWDADVNGDQAAELKAKGRTDLKASPAFGTMFLTLLCSKDLPPSLHGGPNPLADVRVRQALAMTIRKEPVVRNITRMGELPARTYMPPDGTLADFTFLPGPFDARKEPYTYKEMQQRLVTDEGLTGPGPGLAYDVQRARALLAEAGYPNGAGFPALPILYPTNSPPRRDICQVLKNQWKESLNIDIQIEGVEGKIFSARCSAKDYWIATVSWYGDYPDVSTFTDKYLPTSSENDSAWINRDYEKLCVRAESEPDPAKRLAILAQAENLIDTEVPIVPIYHYVNTSLNRPWVHGVEPNPRNVTIFKHITMDPHEGSQP